MSERFVFGVPLIARRSCRDWALVDRLLALTLRSVLAQRDGDWTLVLAGHDRPPCWGAVADDPRCVWLQADWPADAPDRANNDGGRKKWLVKRWMAKAGGGLLMFLDADDWVDRDLVRAARAAIGRGVVGGLVTHGVAVDAGTGRAAPFPIDGFAFHELCGSSTVGRIDPAGAREVDRDPHTVLGSHGDWARSGWPLAMLDVQGAYLVGTGQSHSEAAGPYTEWRRGFAETVRRTGAPLDAATAERFGVSADAPALIHQAASSAGIAPDSEFGPAPVSMT